MAYVETRKSDGKRRGRYPVPGRKSDASTPWTTARESVVLRTARDLEAEARRQGLAFVDPRKGDVPFGEFAKTFLKRYRKRGGTMARRRWLLRTIILPRFEHTPIGGFAWGTLTEWADTVHAHSETTVRQSISLISTILTAAVDAKLIPVNPIYRRVWAGRVHAGHSRPTVWSYPGPVVRISERMEHEAQALMVLIGQFTGMRFGEICALRRDNVLVDHVIRVNGKDHVFKVLRVDPDEGAWHEETRQDADGPEDQITYLVNGVEHVFKALRDNETTEDADGREYQITYLGPPKNEGSARDVFLPQFLIDRIERHVKDCPHIYPFSTQSGTLWLRSNWCEVLRPAADGRTGTPDRVRKPTSWQRIAGGVLAAIDRGALKPGDALPTLSEQAEKYQAGRATVQKAVDWLAEQRVVDRSQYRTCVAWRPAKPAPPVTVVPGREEWQPLVPGWTLRGGRHWCKSAAEHGDARGMLPKAFVCDQFGHKHPGIDGVYTHVLLDAVQRFTALMEREWRQAKAIQDGCLPDSSQRVENRGGRRRHVVHVRRSAA